MSGKSEKPVVQPMQISGTGDQFPVASRICNIKSVHATSGIFEQHGNKAQIILTFIGEDNVTGEPMSFTGYMDVDDASKAVVLIRKRIINIPIRSR